MGTRLILYDHILFCQRMIINYNCVHDGSPSLIKAQLVEVSIVSGEVEKHYMQY